MRFVPVRLLLLLVPILAAMTFAAAPPSGTQVLDSMDDTSGWKTRASDSVQALVHGANGTDGNALALSFDLGNTAGYAAATRVLPIGLPDDYEISFWMRGVAGRNNLEVKFVDASGDNVWWYHRSNVEFSGDWQQVRIKRRQIEFAWGPAIDRTLHRFESIEFVISAGEDGGSGTLWFDQLALASITHDEITEPPTAHASSERNANIAALATDDKAGTAWQSARGAEQQSLELDLHGLREFGGLEIDWAPGQQASRYVIEGSTNGEKWQILRTITSGNGGRDSHLLPESEARFLRLTMPNATNGVGISEIHIRDLEFGASSNAFIESLAKDARRGCYPRSFVNEQIYWTLVGVDGDSEESLLSEDGALEVRKAGYSIEPFIKLKNELVTWADVSIQHSLAEGYLPIPTVQWQHPKIELSTTAWASGDAKNTYTHAVYRLKNPASMPQRVMLALAVRPFQVNPPTQFLNTVGGVSPIRDLSFDAGVVSVNGMPGIHPHTSPRSFLAVNFDADTPCEWLITGNSSDRIHDETGFASGALLYDIALEPGASQEITLDFPLHPDTRTTPPEPATLTDNANLWREKLNRVELELPAGYQQWFDTLRSSLAYVLINRDGPALQPGSRAYERSWIRDGAMSSELLLRLGHGDAARDFLKWYASYQFPDGKIPCCVDHRGADPVPENDSHGEFLYLIDTIHRYIGDTKLLKSLWPAIENTVQYMDKLRMSERTEANTQGDRKAFYGLLPASISHEGYAAKPMHSYWDDFWALAGYESAIHVAQTLDKEQRLRSFVESRDQFQSDLIRSLQTAMTTHGINYLPGAAELGDFDATSASIALAPVGAQALLPHSALHATFERYWQNFTTRRNDTTWDAYTPYEWRNLGAFTRLGWRERGIELIDFLMKDRRPIGWNHWAEVVGRDPREPRFIGDMPHGWVAADYGRALLDLFAFERLADEALVLMAGVPAAWTKAEGFAVKRLRTPFGSLSYSLKIGADKRVLDITEIKMPTGGVVIAWPEGQRPAHQTITRGAAHWSDSELRVSQLPFRVEFSQ